MITIWLQTLISVFIVSLISFIGVLTLAIKLPRLKALLLFLVSLSAGALLGDVFYHLLPELLENNDFSFLSGSLILLGIILFIILEQVVHWRHCHVPTSVDHPHTLAVINLVGDGCHNFLDGMIIAASFLVSFPLGLATTLAVILHEIPQEIGEFGVLIYAGYSRLKALTWNFLSALMAVLGALVTLALGQRITDLNNYIIPLTIGGFLYIAIADLIPELKKELRLRQAMLQIIILISGLALMWSLTWLES